MKEVRGGVKDRCPGIKGWGEAGFRKPMTLGGVKDLFLEAPDGVKDILCNAEPNASKVGQDIPGGADALFVSTLIGGTNSTTRGLGVLGVDALFRNASGGVKDIGCPSGSPSDKEIGTRPILCGVLGGVCVRRCGGVKDIPCPSSAPSDEV